MDYSISNNQQRIAWVDMIKAICIFSLLINHCQFQNDWLKVDYYFLVGFFFCSGYVYKVNTPIGLRTCKIVDTLVIPAVLWPFIGILLNQNNIEYILKDGLGGALLNYGKILIQCSNWFVEVLIIIELTYSLLYSLLQRYSETVLIVLCLMLFFWGLTENTSWIFHVDTAIYAMIFFILGTWYKRIEGGRFDFLSNRMPTPIIFLLSLLFLVLSDCFFPIYPFNTSVNHYNNRGLLVLMNIIGIALLVIVSKRLPSNRYTRFLSRNSLLIYLIHNPFLYYIYMAVFSWTKGGWLDNSIISMIYCFLISILVLWPMITIMNKYIPSLSGKGKIVQNYYKQYHSK